MKAPFFISLLAALCLQSTVLAQSYSFKNYQVHNGLSSNTITTILQDKKGFIWLGTRNGLNRFDGNSFKIFRNNKDDKTSLGSSSVLTLSEDNRERIWVGTYKGIYRYDPLLENFTPFTQVPMGETRYINHDQHGNTWIVNNFSLYRYNTNSGIVKSYATDSTQVVTMAISENGMIWTANFAGIIRRYDPRTDSFIPYDLQAAGRPEPVTIIQDIYPISDTTLLIGTMNRVLLFNTITNKLENVLKDEPGNIQVHKILKQSASEYWLGTETGLYILDIHHRRLTPIRKQYGNPYAITDNVIYSFCKDREGGTWIGTFFGGVNYYSPQLNQFRKYFPQEEVNSLSGNLVHEICGDENGDIWIGTEDAGLNKLDTRTGVITHFMPGPGKSSIAYSNIHGLLADGNELWVGTYEHGLDVLDIRTGNVIRHYEGNGKPGSLRGNFIVSLYKTRNGDILVGTWTGLSKYDRTTGQFINDPFLSMQVQAMHEDETGTIWICSYGNGVYYFNPHTNTRGHFRNDPADANSLPGNHVNNIYEDSRKNIWFCTEAGLCRYDPLTGKMQRISNPNALPDNQVFRILEDNAGIFWISTSKGLLSYNPVNGNFQTYTTVNGLLSEQFNYNSAYKDPQGRLYFGTVKGMISFDPLKFGRNTYTPPVYITGIQVNNVELNIDTNRKSLPGSVIYSPPIELPYDSSSFSFDVAALSYITPETNEYSYIMEGLDKEWTTIKSNRKIFYTKLPPGHYTFRVKGTGDGWHTQETTLSITVRPPFWASSWAYLLYTLVGVGIIGIIFRYYQLAVREKNKRQLTVLEREKERDIYNAKIEFFTNIAHEIRTPLTLIKLPLDKLLQYQHNPLFTESLSLMKKNTARLIELTDQLLDFRKAEANKLMLNFVKTDITDLLKELLNAFKPAADEKKITLRLEVPRLPLQASVDPEAFRKILSNLFNNAIKYADTTVLVKLLPFSSEDTSFHIDMRNDGYLIPMEYREKIFEPFFRLKETGRQAGTGIGLPLSRSLAELHKGTLELKTAQDGLNVFLLTIPIHQETEIDLQGYETMETEVVVSEAEEPEEDPGKMRILLVEDNREILQFVQKELKYRYTIYRALNGAEAIEILEKTNIHLVISDIMMPVMDGIELCRKIKADLQYSHIPIILLTAKNTLTSRIEGLEVGADAYIEKPFSIDHLSAQISNLLSNRQIIKDYFAKSPLAHIKGIAISPTDKTFMEELQQIIHTNITDMDLDVDKLSRMMNMSRTSFYRKIKALSDLSPNELINVARLKKAAELLSGGEYKINEVARMVGYSITSNFSRDFHKQFGEPPSAYVAGLKQGE